MKTSKPVPNYIVYNDREKEVLESPDGYKLFIYRGQSTRVEWPEKADDLLTAEKALQQAYAIEAKYPFWRALIYAARKIDGEIRLAHVSKAFVGALVDLGAND